MPHSEQIATVENENTHLAPEHSDMSPFESIQGERGEDMAEESAQAQEAAEREATLVLEKIRQLPDKPSEGATASKTSIVEHQKSEKLTAVSGALNGLFEIAEQRSLLARMGARESLKLLARGPKDFFVEMKAFSLLRGAKEDLKKAFVSQEEKEEVLVVLSRIMNGMDDNENIKTYYSNNAAMRKKLCALGAEILFDNQDALLESLHNPSPLVEEAVGKILSGLVTHRYALPSSPSRTDQEIEALSARFSPLIQKRIDILKKDPGTKNDLFEHYAIALRPALLQDDKENGSVARDAWCEAFLAGKNQEMLKEILGSYVYSYGTKNKRGKEVLSDLVARMGLDPEKFYDADKNKEEYKAKENYINNILAAQAFESSAPGSVKKLAGEYGIRSFARYPKELLLRQLETEDDLETPYGIVLNPREDWNGGFYGGERALAALSNSARDEKMNVRAFECESKMDAAKKLMRLNRKYGIKQKIQFAIVGGHGDRGALEFGQEDRKTLTKKDLEGKVMQELRSFFSEDATIVLNSCSTGDDFGLGEILSRLVKIKVIAPDSPTSLRSLRVTSGGAISAEYRKDPDKEKSPLRAYASGKLEVGTRSETARKIEELIN